ncbi:MAG TPA: hypothetical protein VGI66_13990 [Streptosporangiaceae bacterium]
MSAAAVPQLTWSKPVKLEKAPFVFGLNMVSIACPSSHFCAASDVFGNVVSSSHPAGGSAAWSAATPVATNFYFRPLVLSCPTANFCAARFERTIYTSTSPGSSRPVWRKSFTAPQDLNTLDCPSTKLCVAVSAGKLVSSGDPAARRATWHVVSLGHRIGYPSCPSASFCAAVSGGDVVTSTHPTGASHAWKITNIDGAARLSNLTCSSARFCLALDDLDRVAYSTDPASGSARWHFTAAPSTANLIDVTCASPVLCLARVQQNGGVIATTTHPTDGSVTWQQHTVNGAFIDGLSCAGPSFCAAATYHGLVAISTDPAASPPHWTSANVDGFTQVNDVACASAKLCLAADAAGRTFTTVDPTGGPTTWHPTNIDGTNLISNINCPVTSFCAVASSDGNLLMSTDPALGSAAHWVVINVPSGLSDLSCQTTSFCAGVDGAGLLTSTDPTFGPPTWHQGSGGTGLTRLTCPSSKLCAGILAGSLVTTTDPTASSPHFTTTTFGSNSVDKVYCPRSSLCVAVGSDSAGRIFFFSSTHPDAGITAWRVSKAPAIGQLACPSGRECFVLKYNPSLNRPGAMFTTTDPAAAAPTWHESTAPLDLVSISCPVSTFCVGAYIVSNFAPSVSGGIKTAVPAKTIR